MKYLLSLTLHLLGYVLLFFRLKVGKQLKRWALHPPSSSQKTWDSTWATGFGCTFRLLWPLCCLDHCALFICSFTYLLVRCFIQQMLFFSVLGFQEALPLRYLPSPSNFFMLKWDLSVLPW